MIISKSLFHNIKKSFEIWTREHAAYGFIIGLFGIFLTFLTIIIPNLRDYLLKDMILIVIFLICLIIYFIYSFLSWKDKNFYLTTINLKYLLILEYNTNILTVPINCISIPSEYSLDLNIKINFDEYIKKDLIKNSEYIIAFKKPKNLDITYNPSKNIKFNIVDNGIYKNQYIISFDFRNNNFDSHSFRLECNKGTNGILEIFFVPCPRDMKNIFNHRPLCTKKVCSTELSISYES